MPGGRNYGSSSTTSFSPWLPIMCIGAITLLYVGYKINNSNFLITEFGEYVCEYKTMLGQIIDEQFKLCSLLITGIIAFVYVLWFRKFEN